MSADRLPGSRRTRGRRPLTEVTPADVDETPAAVADAMEEATQRLREQAWKINATTKMPLLSEKEIGEQRVVEPSSEAGRTRL